MAEGPDGPAVSVIMNCLNGEQYLREAMDSVFAQTYTDWEIVFWDNASTDSSAAIARSYGGRVRYFRSGETCPLGKARNLAITEARGAFLAFLDCDDLWLPDKLERQMPLFDTNPNVALVFCDTMYFGEKGDIRRIYQRHKPPRGRVFRSLWRRYFLSMETVVVRKDSLRVLDQWFDDGLSVSSDIDLFLRLARHWEFDYVDAPLAKWRVHPGNESYKKYFTVADEGERILGKFLGRGDGFEEQYRDEIAAFRQRLVWQKALGELRRNRLGECRRILKEHAAQDSRARIAYLLTYIHPSLLEHGVAWYHKWLS